MTAEQHQRCFARMRADADGVIAEIRDKYEKALQEEGADSFGLQSDACCDIAKALTDPDRIDKSMISEQGLDVALHEQRLLAYVQAHPDVTEELLQHIVKRVIVYDVPQQVALEAAPWPVVMLLKSMGMSAIGESLLSLVFMSVHACPAHHLTYPATLIISGRLGIESHAREYNQRGFLPGFLTDALANPAPFGEAVLTANYPHFVHEAIKTAGERARRLPPLLQAIIFEPPFPDFPSSGHRGGLKSGMCECVFN